MSTPPPADPPAAPSPEIRSAALDWFVRRGSGRIDAAEETAFQAWLAADARHGAAFAHWQRDWGALDALPAEGLRMLRKRLSADKAAAHAASQRRAWWRGLADWAPQGALAAVLLTVAGGSYLAWSHWQQPLFAQSFATARGEQLDVALPDGSRLRLDTATRADVTLYRQRRELRLPEGQTVLQIKSDAGRPFDVLAGPLRITVVGTRFSVRYT
ncbi:MAG: FecR domain-containing protein, partial [Variovorax sp.]